MRSIAHECNLLLATDRGNLLILGASFYLIHAGIWANNFFLIEVSDACTSRAPRNIFIPQDASQFARIDSTHSLVHRYLLLLQIPVNQSILHLEIGHTALPLQPEDVLNSVQQMPLSAKV